MSGAPHEPSSGHGAAAPIRVLVVAAQDERRTALGALLQREPALEIVGWASGISGAADATARCRPDVIVMEIVSPATGGLKATQRIMQETPTPIVLIASGPGELAGAAGPLLEAGALALVERPGAGAAGARAAEKLVATVKSMAEVRVIRRWAPERLHHAPQARGAAPTAPPQPAGRLEVVVIGASTGGPQALREILALLPATFALPVLVVQHIGASFTASLLDWLRPQCALPIEMARGGVALTSQGIYLAPSGRHLILRGRSLALTDEPPVGGHRPSATILFRAAGAAYGAGVVGVLLSGMGDDGAAGLRDVKNGGGVTIAQDEASSVVFGMPAVAISLGAADYVLPPAQIAPLLIELAMRGRGEG